MKRIVIDCRYLGMSGIGRVLEGYLLNLDFSSNEYFFLGSIAKLKEYGITKNILEDNNSPVSKKGMFVNKKVNEYDCFFTPNFIIPFGIKISVYTIIHDLLFLDFSGSVNGFLDYKIKKFFLNRCIKKSKHIFTVSNFSKNRVLYHYPKYKKPITVVYNGLSQSIINFKNEHSSFDKKNYIIFVGNIKKQKGISTLIEAFKGLKNDMELYLVGEKNNFRTEDEKISTYLSDNRIHFTGKVDDDKLYTLIAEAKYLVQPSLYEGFGLPPLEALFLKTKPIISNIEVFKELYSKLDVKFFEVNNPLSLRACLEENIPYDVDNLPQAILDKYNFKSAIFAIVKEIEAN